MQLINKKQSNDLIAIPILKRWTLSKGLNKSSSLFFLNDLTHGATIAPLPQTLGCLEGHCVWDEFQRELSCTYSLPQFNRTEPPCGAFISRRPFTGTGHVHWTGLSHKDSWIIFTIFFICTIKKKLFFVFGYNLNNEQTFIILIRGMTYRKCNVNKFCTITK